MALQSHQPLRKAAKDKKPDRRMLDLLVCPLTKGPLEYDEEASELISARAKLAYPVRGAVAILLPSEARVLTEEPIVPADEAGAVLGGKTVPPNTANDPD